MEEQFKLTSTSGKEIYIPAHTVEFLEELTDEKLKQLNFAVNFSNNIKTLGVIARFIVMGSLAIAAMVFTIWSQAKNSLSH